MSLQKYATKEDRSLVHNLLKLVLVDGNTISVYDGEEWVLKKSSKTTEIKKELAATGEDHLRVRNSEGVAIGGFSLIYDNGSEDEPMICLSDYSSNAYCDGICEKLNDHFDN